MNTTTDRTLLRSSVSALKWNYAGVMVRTLCGLAIGVVLARILGPEPFGQVAVAMLVIGLANLVADFGFGAALVQHDVITDADIRFVFTLQTVLGLVLAGIVMMAAGEMASAFHSHEVARVVRALAPVFVLQALGQTAASLLKRDLSFRALQVAQISSYLIAYLVLGIPLALMGLGVWSLVLAQLCQSVLHTIQLYVRTRHSLKPTLRRSSNLFVGFGTKVVATNIVNWVVSNIDNVLIGRVFGVVDLGFYNRTFLLTMTPMTGVLATLQGVLFPSYSRAQYRLDALRRSYLASVSVVALIIFPVFLSVAVVSSTVVLGLYGSSWAAAVPILSPLAVAMLAHAVTGLAGPLIWGTGKVERELRVQASMALTMVAVLLIASRFSLVAVAWSVCGVYFLRSWLMTRAAVRLLDIRWADIARSLRGAILFGMATAACVWSGDTVAASVGLPVTARLAVVVVMGTLTIPLLMLIFRRVLWQPETVWFWERVATRVPRWIRPFVPALVRS